MEYVNRRSEDSFLGGQLQSFQADILQNKAYYTIFFKSHYEINSPTMPKNYLTPMSL